VKNENRRELLRWQLFPAGALRYGQRHAAVAPSVRRQTASGPQAFPLAHGFSTDATSTIKLAPLVLTSILFKYLYKDK